MSFKRFDVAAELQNLRSTPPKPAKPPKDEGKISHFSGFRWGASQMVQSTTQRRGDPPTASEGYSLSSGNRNFLPRPLGQEHNPKVWTAWTPLMVWLLEHYPDHYHLVWDAEDTLTALERQGTVSGEAYEQAGAELLRRFETARRLALSKRVKVWLQ